MKRYKVILSMFLALGVLSCDDYLDINESPNNPTAEIVTPDLALGGSINQPYRVLVEGGTSMSQLGNLFMNSWAGNVNQFGSIYTTEFDLAIDVTFYSRIWENLYLNTLGLTDIINYESENYDNHKAIAKVVKAYYFQYLVDLYGDIPYSEAHDVANPTPVYDDDQAIYRDLYVQLDEAIALINSADGDDRAVGGEDPVFNGNMQSWVRFANSIKLRLLLRESGVAASQGYITGKFAELATADFISADVTINPGYTGAQANQQNPFYRSYGFGIDGTTPGPNRTAVVASSHAVDYLNGGANNSTGGSTVFDPRLMRLFESIYANWDDSTDPTDIVASDAAAFNDFNYAADFFGATQGELGDSDTPEKLSFLGPGLIKSSSQDGYMMLLAESLLLQSEAVTRGYMAGDAAALYNSAIAASFATLGVPTADPRPTGQTFDTDGNPATPPVNFHPVADPNYPTLATYMASIAGTQLDYNTATNKIEAIMTQKWIALMGINGIESFIEYTRTGFPVTPLSETATRPTKPRRLLYPASEFQGNAANAPVQSVDQAFSTGPFWYVGS